jgi:Tfp pilus assembly protein PilN
MNSSINLVSGKNDEVEKEQKRLRIVRIIAALSLIFVALFSILIFVINFTLPLEAVKKNQQLELANIASMHQKLAKYTILSDRISSISDIISKRNNYDARINAIYSKIPGGISVDSLDVQLGEITLGVSGPSLLSVNDLINGLIDLKDKNKIIKNINIQGLTFRPTDGVYSLTARLAIP